MKDYNVILLQNNELCPQNNCKIEIDDGELHQNMFDSQLYSLVGIMNIWREENGDIRSNVYDLSSTLKINEKFEKDDITTLYFDGNLNLGDSIDLEVINGTITLDGKKALLHIQTE